MGEIDKYILEDDSGDMVVTIKNNNNIEMVPGMQYWIIIDDKIQRLYINHISLLLNTKDTDSSISIFLCDKDTTQAYGEYNHTKVNPNSLFLTKKSLLESL